MRRWARPLGLLALVLSIPAVWALTPLGAWTLAAIDHLRSAGPWGAVAFGLLVVLSGPMVFSAEAVMAASGFLYGPWYGGLLAWACLHGAALANLLLARTLLRERVHRLLGGNPFSHIDDLVLSQGATLVALLRLPPLSPYHVISYTLGLTPIRTRDAMLGTALGSVPQVALFAWIGSTLSDVAGLAHASASLSPAAWLGVLAVTALTTVGLTVYARRKLQQISGGRVGTAHPTH